MKYHIEGVYYSDSYCRIEQEWRKIKNIDQPFKDWLIEQSGSNYVSGNWEDGWTIEFFDEEKFTWFLLKWA